MTVTGAHISSVDSARPTGVLAIDCAPIDLIPGCVDLHGDSYEALARQYGPIAGAAQFSRRCLEAGITTAFGCVAVEHSAYPQRSPAAAIPALLALRKRVDACRLRTHLRVDVTGDGAEVAVEALRAGLVDLVSLMDHTPGQGQFRTVESWRLYRRRQGEDEATIDDRLARLRAGRPRVDDNRCRVLEAARLERVTVLSHDDDGPVSVAANLARGVNGIEFPVRASAAAEARRRRARVIMGAGNVLAGGSRYGNLSVRQALALGSLDALVSDHSPEAMLPAAYTLADGGLTWKDAVRLVSSAPAAVAGLTDRGRIAAGQIADMIAVRYAAGNPSIERRWLAGHPTA
ncbi:amidohydrolase family protein [Mycobacterium interjectum]|uniref:amidohydrolase family protein n=1 Tax=Mycobacterium interjectum TaxID=33895 RepID=UPI00135A5D16|nr:amidohydrolase family protein [Mycobacterium interjectum]MCV7089061.1 amidohydrolase family protein [Mycobacterium interjectum]